MLDADGSTDGADIVRFIGALMTGADYAEDHASLVAAAATTSRRCADGATGSSAPWSTGCSGPGTPISASTAITPSGARHLPALAVDGDGFEIKMMMNIRAARAGLLIQEYSEL